MNNITNPIWDNVKAERLKLAALLEPLSIAQWDTISLVPKWRIRDVVAHLILESLYTPRMYIPGMIKAGLNINRFMDSAARNLGSSQPAALITQLRATASDRVAPGRTTPEEVLLDIIIHTQDISRPLNLNYDPSPNLVAGTLKVAIPSNLKSQGLAITGADKRLKDIHLQAIDSDWHLGSGADVRGRTIDLLLVATGRYSEIQHITGLGVKLLQARK